MGYAGNCVAANINVLSLLGSRIEFNLCRTLEWQVCGAQGVLPGQFGEKIVFATAPKSLDIWGRKSLGACGGWVPDGIRAKPHEYASHDVFFLETCLLHQICINGDELFELDAGQPFACNFSQPRFEELQQILVEPAEGGEPLRQCGTSD